MPLTPVWVSTARVREAIDADEMLEEAAELEQGHLAHGEPENPVTGEPEDTEVGFPGPEHHIAERAKPMAIASASGGISRGHIPLVHHAGTGCHGRFGGRVGKRRLKLTASVAGIFVFGNLSAALMTEGHLIIKRSVLRIICLPENAEMSCLQ